MISGFRNWLADALELLAYRVRPDPERGGGGGGPKPVK